MKKTQTMKIILFEFKNTFLKLNWFKVHLVFFFFWGGRVDFFILGGVGLFFGDFFGEVESIDIDMEHLLQVFWNNSWVLFKIPITWKLWP